MKDPNEWKDWPSLPLEQRDALPTFSGIYVVADFKDQVSYVGQAVNLNARWRAQLHHRYEQLIRLNGKRRYKIHWKPCPPEELNWMERDYISAFRPVMNRSKVKKYSLGKPKLKILSNKDPENPQYVYFRGKPETYEEISEFVGIFPCTEEDEDNMCVERDQVIRLGLVMLFSIAYEVDGKKKTAKIFCSLPKLGTIHQLSGRPYRGGKIVDIWVPQTRRYI